MGHWPLGRVQWWDLKLVVRVVKGIRCRLFECTLPIAVVRVLSLRELTTIMQGTSWWPVHLTRPPTPLYLGQTLVVMFVLCSEWSSLSDVVLLLVLRPAKSICAAKSILLGKRPSFATMLHTWLVLNETFMFDTPGTLKTLARLLQWLLL